MSFKNNIGPGRPSSHWNNYDGPLKPTISKIHNHEFGPGYDIQYKDTLGNVQAGLDGLTPAEANYLKITKKY